MKKIKIMHLITCLEVAGAQKVILELCRYINQDQFEVTVVAIAKRDEMLPIFQNNNIRVEILGSDKTIFSIGKAIKRLSGIIKNQQINILHAHLTHACILSTILKIRFPKLQLIFTSHSFNLGSKLRDTFVRSTKFIRSADIIFSKKMHRNIYRKDAVVIANGIHTETYQLNCPKFKIFTFISIGRLKTVKNHIALIRPVKNLIKQGYVFQLLIVGEGKNRNAIEQAIEENGLKNHIQLLGLRRDIPELCNQAHCFVLPSLWEGLPIALLEAGAASLPVISMNVGSIHSLVNENSGYLLANEYQLDNTMALVMDDYEVAKQKGQNLQQKIASQFDIQAIVQKHEVLYRQLTKGVYDETKVLEDAPLVIQ